MPTPILKIPVDDEAFKRFLSVFEKFRKHVDEQPDAWRGVSDGIKGAAEEAASFAEALTQQANETRRIANEEDSRDKKREAAARKRKQEDDEARKREQEAVDRRKRIIDQTREYGRVVTNTLLNAGKWAVGGGLLSAALGGFGLANLVSGVVDQRRSAMGFGVGMGQQQGLGVQLQRYFDVNSVLENVANAQANPAQWGALRVLGVNPNSGNAADLTYQIATAARRMFRADKGNLALAGAQGLTQFFTPDDLRRMAGESDQQFNSSIRQSRQYAGLNNDVGLKWQNFMVNLDMAGKKIENTLVTKLTRLEPDLERIVGKFGDLAVKVLDRIDFDKLGRGLDKFTGYITSPQFQADFKTFVDDVSILANKIVDALKFLGLIPGNSSSNGAPTGSSNAIAATFGFGGKKLSGAIGTDVYESQAQAFAASAFQKWGWSPNQTAGILSNLHFESNLNPLATGDHGAAYGIGQWHGDRQRQYAKLFGHSMQSVRDPSQALQEQLQFVQWELTHTFRNAGKDLKKTLSAYSAGATVSNEYERPAWKRTEAVRRGVYATVGVTIKNQTGASVATTVNSTAGG